MADKKAWVKLTNKGPGPRMVLLPTEGKTIQKGASAILQMTENDYKGIQPYISLGHIVVSDPTHEEIAALSSFENNDIGDTVQSGSVDAAKNIAGDIVPNEPDLPDDDDDDDESTGDGTDIDDVGAPTHVEHRGFGRFFGMSGDEKITSAMSEAEADAYAEEHGLKSPVKANPSAENQDLPAEEPAPSADETVDETANETADETTEETAQETTTE